MKQTYLIMGMPVTVEVVDPQAKKEILEEIFDYFRFVDRKFSTYKENSEISKINKGKLLPGQYSQEMKKVFKLAEQTQGETDGYFNIRDGSKYDPSGLVKGWAINNAAEIIKERGFRNFYIDAGGDVQVSGKNNQGQNWKIGIRNPFDKNEIVKAIEVIDCGVATSGTYERGQHIYNPHNLKKVSEIVSLTVIGPNIYEADRFATAAFAMGRAGIDFIEKLSGLEGYMIDSEGLATLTSGFDKYVVNSCN